MKRVLSLLFLGIVLIALAGCGSTGATPEASRFVEVAVAKSSTSSLSDIWTQVGEAAGIDSDKARLVDITLGYSPTGALIRLAISAATPDGRLVSASWSGTGGQAADMLNIGVDVSGAASIPAPSEAPLIGTILGALDRAGVNNMIAAINEERPVEFYTLHALQGPSDHNANMPSEHAAFIWDGSHFISPPLDDRGRAYTGSSVCVIVYPMATVSPSKSVQAQETATTGAWQSLPPGYFVIPE